MKISTFIKKIDKFNDDLKAAIEKIGENCFFEVDTTIIGDNSPIEPFTYQVLQGCVKVTDPNCGDVNRCETEDGQMTEDWDMDNVLDSIKFYNRMIKKTIRVYESENPDRELEKDDWQLGQDTED